MVFADHRHTKSKGMLDAIVMFQEGADLEQTNSFLDFSLLEHAPTTASDSVGKRLLCRRNKYTLHGRRVVSMRFYFKAIF